MASHARLFLTDVLTALRTDLGDNDLSTVSGTPRVVIADSGAPPIGPPYVLLSAPSLEKTYDAPLTEYHVIGTLHWWAYVAMTADTTEDRAYKALDFGDEICTAIENAHHNAAFATLYTTTVVICSWDEVFSDGPDIPPGMAIVHGTIRYETDLSRGA
jgi:hypothetical protein